MRYDYVTDGHRLYQRVPSKHESKSALSPTFSFYVPTESVPVGSVRGIPATENMLELCPGSYLRVHRSVVEVDCPFCHATKGHRCTGAFGQPVNYRHADRARAARELRRR